MCDSEYVEDHVRELVPRAAWRIAVVVKVESYRLTFTNNRRYHAPRSSACRPAERYQALKGVPLVSVAWFRVPLLRRTVRTRYTSDTLAWIRTRHAHEETTEDVDKGPGYIKIDGETGGKEARRMPAMRDLVALISRRSRRAFIWHDARWKVIYTQFAS